MARRILLGCFVFCVLVTPALGDDITQKQQVDQAIQSNQAKLDATRANESVLRSKISVLDNRIGALESQVGSVTNHLSVLQHDLSLRQRRLIDLGQLYKLQTHRLNALKKEYKLAVRRLNNRLVAIYENGTPSTLDFVLGSSSIDDMLAKINFVTLIGKEDKKIATEVKTSKLAMQSARTETRAARLKVLDDKRALAARAAQVVEARDALVGAASQLSTSKSQQASNLSSLSAQDQALANEISQEQAQSAALQAAILAAQTHSSTTATPSSAGLIWPVNGPITSPYGPRCFNGTCGFHPGIDIGVPSGTPIAAAATGKVIYCGWESGYGNLVVLDNGNNLATAYAHQSRIAVSCGETVSQGQILGYTGCTGYCFGPHLHFEVRIDGHTVDPLGYLP